MEVDNNVTIRVDKNMINKCVADNSNGTRAFACIQQWPVISADR